MLEAELVAAGAKVLHVKKIMARVAQASAPGLGLRAKLNRARAEDGELSKLEALPAVVAAREWRRRSSKSCVAFVSFHKGMCAMEAQFIKME